MIGMLGRMCTWRSRDWTIVLTTAMCCRCKSSPPLAPRTFRINFARRDKLLCTNQIWTDGQGVTISTSAISNGAGPTATESTPASITSVTISGTPESWLEGPELFTQHLVNIQAIVCPLIVLWLGPDISDVFNLRYAVHFGDRSRGTFLQEQNQEGTWTDFFVSLFLRSSRRSL